MSRLRSAIQGSLLLAAAAQTRHCEAFVLRSSPAAVGSSLVRLRPSRAGLSRPTAMEMKSDRAGFIREGALGIAGATGLLGRSSPASAAGSKDVIELVQVPTRTMIGKTQPVTWKKVAPAIAAMRAEARQHFAKIDGAKGGKEVTLFTNETPTGTDITVGLEVSDAAGSPALSDGFTASVLSSPGEYLRDDHDGRPGTLPWFSFISQLTKDGYSFKQPTALFEVYSGQGGQETVTMYVAVERPVG